MLRIYATVLGGHHMAYRGRAFNRVVRSDPDLRPPLTIPAGQFLRRLQNVSMTGEHCRALRITPEHSTRSRKSLTGKVKLRKSRAIIKLRQPVDTGSIPAASTS